MKTIAIFNHSISFYNKEEKAALNCLVHYANLLSDSKSRSEKLQLLESAKEDMERICNQ